MRRSTKTLENAGVGSRSWVAPRAPFRGDLGVGSPEREARYPRALLAGALLALAATACSGQDQELNLDPVEVGMTPSIAPIFDDGETQLFEVKRGVAFPILAPSAAAMDALAADPVEPYGREPWITNQDVRVQISWTLSNLDEQGHAVEVLIDPWSEFGRYWPGLQLTDAERQDFKPNRSGIDEFFPLDGKGSGETSRRHGTYTFDDLNEMAIDFATVLNMIKNPPGVPNGMSLQPGQTNALPTYVNHAFNLQNNSSNDPLVGRYVPAVVAGLTGVDFGLRTYEPATIALEIVIEVVDTRGDRVAELGDTRPLLPPPDQIITVGTAGPAN